MYIYITSIKLSGWWNRLNKLACDQGGCGGHHAKLQRHEGECVGYWRTL